MKVNIGGKGSIPGLGVLAPAFGVEMDKQGVRRLLNFPTFRVYQTSTGLIITTTNIDEMFKTDNKVAVTVKPVEKKPVINVSTDIPTKDDPYTGDKNGIGGLTPLIEETTVDVEETPLPEITAENIDVEKVNEITEPVVDTTGTTDEVIGEDIISFDDGEDEVVEEEAPTTSTEDKPQQSNQFNRKKKRRH